LDFCIDAGMEAFGMEKIYFTCERLCIWGTRSRMLWFECLPQSSYIRNLIPMLDSFPSKSCDKKPEKIKGEKTYFSLGFQKDGRTWQRKVLTSCQPGKRERKEEGGWDPLQEQPLFPN
jgi:hypothetical protein